MIHITRRTRFIVSAALGPDESSEFISLVETWLNCSGLEWTTARLKAYWNAAKQLRAGNTQIVKAIYQKNSINYRKDNLVPRGPFGPVVWRFAYTKSARSIRTSACVLRIYTQNILSETSIVQYDKVKESINSPCKVSDAHVQKAFDFVSLGLKDMKLPRPRLFPPDLRRVKAFTATHVGTFSPGLLSDFRVRPDVRNVPYGKFLTSLTTSCWIPDSLKGLNPCEDFRTHCVSMGANNTESGHISFINEGGCKARVVAVPNAWIQWLFQPLHHALDSVIKGLPQSAVHDQNKGAYYMQANLDSGNICHCFDLSSATDRFPREVQVGLLNQLGLENYGQALNDISLGDWDVDSPINTGDYWSYHAGQPMGLYGSFPLFHLSHYALLQGIVRFLIETKKDLTVSSRSFLVLGDDVIITNDTLARYYKELMTNYCGVELSEAKSISSRCVGEFAGFLSVTREGNSTLTWRPYKYASDSLTRINNNLSLVSDLGRRLKPAYWRNLHRRFVFTKSYRHPDLSPLVNTTGDDGTFAPLTDGQRLGASLHMEHMRQLNPDFVVQDFLFGPSLADLCETTAYRLLNEEPATVSSIRKPLDLQGKQEDLVIEDEKTKHIPSTAASDPLMREEKKREVISNDKTSLFG